MVMGGFSLDGGSSAHEFSVDCPVCETTVWLRYVYEWYSGDESTRGKPVSRTCDAAIVEQRCNCLLGDEFAEDALRIYLES